MLTVKKIKSLKPRKKDYKIVDRKGLHLLVTKADGKSWRFKYRFRVADTASGWPTLSVR